MNLYRLDPQAPFLDTLAAAWLAAHGPAPEQLARGLILLPTRRAARALADAFLRAVGGKALLLPRITALGAPDEEALALAGALDIPPAVTPERRLAVLARLILALDGAFGAPQSPDRAWPLAAELAALMDEAERAGVDLAVRLPDATGGEYAAHWQQSLAFLAIVTRAWPDWLAEHRLLNPVARQVALLAAQGAAWQRTPPSEPVWIAGTTGGIAAVARLIATVAALPNGRVILPGLDPDAPAELPPTHPQFGLHRLLAALGVAPADVPVLPAGPSTVPDGRFATLNRALLPAASLAAWRQPAPLAHAGLTRLEPQDEQEEAVAIAMILRDALAIPGARAALVTPDRVLAQRVAIELGRFGIIADDSAGEPLALTPPAVLLRLAAQAVAEHLAPVPLLALLKHPLTACGLAQAACRAAARALERAALRGPRPEGGIAGLRRAVAAEASAAAFLARLEAALEPLLRVFASVSTAPRETLAALIEAGEALAASDSESGAARLWAFEEGAALAERLAAVLDALKVLPDASPASLPGLLDAVLEGAVVRSRRALRGRDPGGQDGAEHPRVFIWGLLEARLQTAELIVLGGLVEGVWPPATDPGPWLSRPMRQAVGLPSPEEPIGLAAHDFVMAACAAPKLVLSCPSRRARAPAVPSRWLARLDALLAGEGQRLPEHPAAAWARLLDLPEGPPRPAPPPRPTPAVALRPRRLSVTEIETWIADPYAIYARHVLRLRPLDPLDQSIDAAEYGALVHQAMQIFLAETGAVLPDDPAARLRAIMDRVLRERGLRMALIAWWAPRLARIADFVAAEEVRRRTAGPIAAIGAEVSGLWQLSVPGDFTLSGRADRIERRADGGLAILDYKTGAVPAEAQVKSGRAPQLPLLAAMAAAGAFGAEWTAPVAELTYWRLSGGAEPGSVQRRFATDPAALADAVAAARDGLASLIVRYDQPGQPYLAQPDPAHAPRYGDYAQLARMGEWAVAED